SAETGCILRLFSQLGIDVVDREATRVEIPEYELSILAVPNTTGVYPRFNPDPAFKYNVLLAHAEVEGILPTAGATPERTAMIVPVSDLHADDWSYVALGHYHVFREIRPNAFYSGSTDYTSVNTWGELAEERAAKIDGKGFIEWHFESNTALF